MPRLNTPCRSAIMRRVTGLVCLVVLLSSCTLPEQLLNPGQVTPSPYPTVVPYLTPSPAPTLPVPQRFQEAPDLAARVQENRLPVLQDRLPERPKVVRPQESVGKYGGTWRMAIQTYLDTAQFIRTVAYEPLVRWTSDWSGVEPNLVEGYQVNKNATEYTFTLRRGLRWSDGEPFTTADIHFWYKDILLNTQLTPVIPAWLKTGGETAKFEFIDAYTFKVRFVSPNYMFLEQLASPDALMITAFPAHYARSFHILHASPLELVNLVDPAMYTSWKDMFIKRVGVDPQDIGNFADPDRPRLTAWVIGSAYRPGWTTVTWYRNPYYWKVDPEGNQLPYIDTVVFSVVNSIDDLVNETVEGRVDMQDLNMLGVDVTASFLDRPDSRYNLYRLRSSSSNVMVLNLNLTHPDATKRAIFQNQNFRIALSHAINRKEIFSLLYNGEGIPWQAAPAENSPFYDPLMATQYTEYSLDKANEFLDRAGYQKDQMGHRLGPDGRPISFSVDVLENKPQQITMLGLVAKYLSEVGINLQPKIESGDVFMATIQENKHDAAAWEGGGTYLSDVLLGPTDYLPINKNGLWAVGWANWYTREEKNRVKPEDEMLQNLALYEQVRASQTVPERIRLMRRCLGMAQVSFWTVGIGRGPEQYGIVLKTFRNVPQEMPSSWIYPNPAPTNPEQYYIEK